MGSESFRIGCGRRSSLSACAGMPRVQLPAHVSAQLVAGAAYCKRAVMMGRMGIADDAVEVRAQGGAPWPPCTGYRDRPGAGARRRHELSVVEFTVLDALSRQDGWHMRMQPARPRRRPVRQRDHAAGQPARGPRAARPGSSAPTTAAASTPSSPTRAGLLDREAAPTHDRVLEQSLDSAGEVPELAPLVRVPARVPRWRDPPGRGALHGTRPEQPRHSGPSALLADEPPGQSGVLRPGRPARGRNHEARRAAQQGE